MSNEADLLHGPLEDRHRDRRTVRVMRMSTEPGYASPVVNVASSLPRRAATCEVVRPPFVAVKTR
ncbi:hypothetical protein MAHJHV28_47480 [Mycobacterium avium subsp. hominissuis]